MKEKRIKDRKVISPQKLTILWRQERNNISTEKSDRLALLRRFAELRTQNSTPKQKRREAFNRCHRPRGKVSVCWCCRTAAILVEHHVVQLQHGGTNWNLNREWICESCHAEVHEWLQESKPVDWSRVDYRGDRYLESERISGFRATKQRRRLDVAAMHAHEQFSSAPRLIQRKQDA